MSTHIQMAEEYSQVTTYYGELDEKHPFMVEISYNSEIGNHEIASIEFVEKYSYKGKDYWKKAEDKIKDFIMKWLFQRKDTA